MSTNHKISMGIVLLGIFFLFGCQQSVQTEEAVKVNEVSAKAPAPTPTANPCGDKNPPSDPYIYKYNTEWEMPGASVPDIYTAAKKVLLDEWKMPSNIDSRNESSFNDYLSASVQVNSALKTQFDMSIIKLNKDSSRFSIHAKSQKISPAQLESQCHMMYDGIIAVLHAAPDEAQNKARPRIPNLDYYTGQNYKLDYSVKQISEAALKLLNEMNISSVSSKYDDFTGTIFFRTGNLYDLGFVIQMTRENECRLVYCSRSSMDDIQNKWGDIFVQRLLEKLAEPTAAELPSVPKALRIFYGEKGGSYAIDKTVEYPYSVITITDTLLAVLKQLQIAPQQPTRDAINSKLVFGAADNSNWTVMISQVNNDTSKVYLSATRIYDAEFEKYCTAIIENLEKELKKLPKLRPSAEEAVTESGSNS